MAVKRVILDYEERKSITEEVLKIADERYVHTEDCNTKQENVNKKFANDDKRIDLLITKINIWEKLLWAIASASVGALVVSVFELILK
jgi:hypothetical protein